VSLSAVVDTNRQFLVELMAQATSPYDLVISKVDTSNDLFILTDSVSDLIRQTIPDAHAIVPRLKGMVELERGARQGSASFLAFDPAHDVLGQIAAVSGSTDIGPGRVVILQGTAGTFDLKVGDSLDLYYSAPIPRREGYAANEEAAPSRTRMKTTVTVVGVVTQRGLFSKDTQNAIITDLDFAHKWLGLEGRCQQLLVEWDPDLYKTNNPEIAVLQARQMAQQVQAALGDEYVYSLSKVKAIDGSLDLFAQQQALVNVYGLMSLGIVGILVRTLIQNNVIENRRDLAILRVLGSPSRRLFSTVIVEVAVLGAIGAVIGIVSGLLLTNYVIAPYVLKNLLELGGTALRPTVSLGTMWPPVLMAIAVLGISAFSPARQASATKVMHAINPGAADNLGLDDLIRFRERRPSARIFLIGLAITFVWIVMSYGFRFAYLSGNTAMSAALSFGLLLAMVIGVAMMFSVLAVPFEQLLLALLSLVAPRQGFFVSRYVKRGKERNTWISLMIVLSATFPVFLATEMALQFSNRAAQVEVNNGAPIMARVAGGMGGYEFGFVARSRPESLALKPQAVDEFRAVPGIGRVAGLTYPNRTQISDLVNMRSTSVAVVGLTDSLNGVVFPDRVEFVGTGPEALDRLVAEKDAVIISEGLAQYLQVSLGGVVRVTGKGADHTVELRVAGIVRRLPGFPGQIGRNQQMARNGNSVVLVSLDTFQALTTDPIREAPNPSPPVLTRFMATFAPGQAVSTPDGNGSQIGQSLRKALTLKYRMMVSVAQEEIARASQEAEQARLFMIVLTVISFVTAIFGVFSVIYVAVNSRRMEIGMMKAIGSSSSHLLLTFMLEAVVMSVSAVLAGVTAGTALGYFDVYSYAMTYEAPVSLTVDRLVTPLTVGLVALASVLSAALASRSLLRRRAVEILREAQ
jgi:ABC-type antimicrobial peptide transport system permease subunit